MSSHVLTSPLAAGASDSPATEAVACLQCGATSSRHFISAEDDLTGKPGRFRFVSCDACGLVQQSPRIPLSRIGEWYGDEYIAHRKKRDWGRLEWIVSRALRTLDRDKESLCLRHLALDRDRQVLDVGSGAGTFLELLRRNHGVAATGVDFIDLSALPSYRDVALRHGLFYEQDFGDARFDLITMWHFLEHDYDPRRSLAHARELLHPEGRIVIEVPRLDSLSFRLFGDRWPGLQAPQHTTLFTRDSLLRMVADAGLEPVAHLPYGAYPAYFYFFAGAAFHLLRGRGLDLRRALAPYLLGKLVTAPFFAFEQKLNLAMQTVVARRRA